MLLDAVTLVATGKALQETHLAIGMELRFDYQGSSAYIGM
jgi:hypothetical protein